jgi:hypothetical protein
MNEGERFDAFLENLKITAEQGQDGETKYKGVTSCLNTYYYGSNYDNSNIILIGSWGKKTRVRPPRDIDLLFTIPYSTYTRFKARVGNIQSQLLQEVRTVLTAKYSGTNVKGDGPVVLVPFTTYKVEVLPAIKLDNGQYWVCDTKGSGKYVPSDPIADIRNLEASDSLTKGNTRHLIRMMKCWQYYCSVPLKSFHIELLAIDFLRNWGHAGKTSIYYDWMVRDFFQYLIARGNGYGCVFAPGTVETLWLGNVWKSRAESAYQRALKACENEAGKYRFLAGDEWQKIFGTQIPIG